MKDVLLKAVHSVDSLFIFKPNNLDSSEPTRANLGTWLSSTIVKSEFNSVASKPNTVNVVSPLGKSINDSVLVPIDRYLEAVIVNSYSIELVPICHL